MERTKTINYYWKRDNEEEVKPEHVEALEESADDRISSQMAEGYTSGELLDNITMTDDDDEDGVGYSGWWTVTTIDN